MVHAKSLHPQDESIAAAALISFFDRCGLSLSDQQKHYTKQAFEYATDVMFEGPFAVIQQPSLFDAPHHL